MTKHHKYNNEDQVELLFCSAMEIESPEERKAFLERACAGDSELCELVERMVTSRAKWEAFFPEGGVEFTLSEDLFKEDS